MQKITKNDNLPVSFYSFWAHETGLDNKEQQSNALFHEYFPQRKSSQSM